MNIRHLRFLQLRGVVFLLSSLCLMSFGVYALPAYAIAQWSREQTDPPNLPHSKTAAKPGLHKGFGKLPLSFIRNDGQLDEKVRYYEKSRGRATYFTNAGVYISLTKGLKKEGKKLTIQNPQSETVGLIPLGANKHPEIFAETPLDGRVNYFIGNDPAKWKSGIPTYKSVFYKGIYEGVDMRFYGNNEHLEYDIVVNPGASPSRVQLSYRGVDGLRVTERGDLEICLKGGMLIQKRPYVYQEIDGKRVEVEGRFKVQSTNSETRNPKSKIRNPKFVYGFQVASYNKNYPLVIDPVLEYSTYLGGSGYDVGNGIAVDDSGNVYVTGETESADFPMANSIYESYRGGTYDVFVIKLNASGSALVYSTYLGGSGSDEANSIAVDASENVYVTGETESSDFPTANALYGSNSGNMDVFLVKLNASGSVMDYSTYLGGSSAEYGNDIAVDTSGNVHVTGRTSSTDFPAVNALYGEKGGSSDVFVTRLNASGSGLEYSTYLGGSAADEASSIAVDTSGNVYVTGYTQSTDFPVANAIYGTSSGNKDAFVSKLNASGSALDYSTYLGGVSEDRGYGIAVDTSGNAYVTGWTSSWNFPKIKAIYWSKGGTNDVFITKIDASGSALDYSTLLGGNSYDYGRDIAVDAAGSVYVTGYTDSTDFPTANALYESYNEGYDIFVTKLNASGSALDYSTYLGGSSYDHGYGIAVDASGSAYVTGYTFSTDFPQANAIYESNSGGYDVFVTKISDMPCELESVKLSSSVVKLKRRESIGVTVTLTGDNDCPIEGEQVTAKITPKGRKFVTITPVSNETDANGEAVFTIKAKKATGRAKIIFQSGSKKASVIIRVRKS